MALAKLDSEITFALSVRDRHASAEWYQKTLGFALRYHIDEAGWSEMSTFTPGVILGLGEQGEPTPGNAVPVFGTPDIDATRAAMEAGGVRFDGETVEVEGMVRMATFYDPDGNALMVAQDLSKTH
ncbi:VOC family protein [uncultured Sulfitobacter sp.]|uniref:VOC family protein n=1 Tax=uncultured Sulfitobacter sp. TaxID=191468 RepID=UPI0026140CCC|nr:VOC family protein [uncultured Sulfitobacter sp.]